MDFIKAAWIVGSEGSNSVPCANCGWSTMLMGLTVTASIAALVAAATASLAPLIALVAATTAWLVSVMKHGISGISTTLVSVKKETTNRISHRPWVPRKRRPPDGNFPPLSAPAAHQTQTNCYATAMQMRANYLLRYTIGVDID